MEAVETKSETVCSPHLFDLISINMQILTSSSFITISKEQINAPFPPGNVTAINSTYAPPSQSQLGVKNPLPSNITDINSTYTLPSYPFDTEITEIHDRNETNDQYVLWGRQDNGRWRITETELGYGDHDDDILIGTPVDVVRLREDHHCVYHGAWFGLRQIIPQNDMPRDAFELRQMVADYLVAEGENLLINGLPVADVILLDHQELHGLDDDRNIIAIYAEIMRGNRWAGDIEV